MTISEYVAKNNPDGLNQAMVSKGYPQANDESELLNHVEHYFGENPDDAATVLMNLHPDLEHMKKHLGKGCKCGGKCQQKPKCKCSEKKNNANGDGGQAPGLDAPVQPSAPPASISSPVNPHKDNQTVIVLVGVVAIIAAFHLLK